MNLQSYDKYFLCNRLITDNILHSVGKRRRHSYHGEPPGAFLILENAKCTPKLADLNWRYGNKSRQMCAEFIEHTMRTCEELSQVNTFSAKPEGFQMIFKQMTEMVQLVCKTAELFQMDIASLLSKLQAEYNVILEENVNVKREKRKTKFSTIKLSNEDLTDDNIITDLTEDGLTDKLNDELFERLLKDETSENSSELNIDNKVFNFIEDDEDSCTDRTYEPNIGDSFIFKEETQDNLTEVNDVNTSADWGNSSIFSKQTRSVNSDTTVLNEFVPTKENMVDANKIVVKSFLPLTEESSTDNSLLFDMKRKDPPNEETVASASSSKSVTVVGVCNENITGIDHTSADQSWGSTMYGSEMSDTTYIDDQDNIEEQKSVNSDDTAILEPQDPISHQQDIVLTKNETPNDAKHDTTILETEDPVSHQQDILLTKNETPNDAKHDTAILETKDPVSLHQDIVLTKNETPNDAKHDTTILETEDPVSHQQDILLTKNETPNDAKHDTAILETEDPVSLHQDIVLTKNETPYDAKHDTTILETEDPVSHQQDILLTKNEIPNDAKHDTAILETEDPVSLHQDIVLTKKEKPNDVKHEQLRDLDLLNSLYVSSSETSDIDSLSNSESTEYDPPERKRPQKKAVKPKSTIVHQAIETIPCYVKISAKEQRLCDEFSRDVEKPINGRKRKRSVSSSSSDRHVKRRIETIDSDVSFPDSYKSEDPMSDDSSLSGDVDSSILDDEQFHPVTKSISDDNYLAPKEESDVLFKDTLKFEIDEDAILKDIVDSDDFECTSDEEEEQIAKKKKTEENAAAKQPSNTNNEVDEASKWKKDALLTTSLNAHETTKASSDGDYDENDLLMRQEDLDKKLQEKMNTLFNSDVKIDSVSIKSDGSDSDIEFINEDEGPLKTISDDSDLEFVSPNTIKTGRRNIRALLSDDTLEHTTKEANKEEKAHMERLIEKRKNLDKILTCSTSYLSQQSGLVLDATEDSVIRVNSYLSERLKPHQEKGVQFMWDACYESVKTLKEHSGGGCILAHCMGLGKTFQVISLIHTLFRHPITNTKHVLVLCPVSTVLNWKNEFNIALEHAKEDPIPFVRVISDDQKTKKSRMGVIITWKVTGGVLIMGYDTFTCLTPSDSTVDNITNATLEALVNPGPDLIVCDEGHLLKNDQALRTKSLMKIRTKRRIIMTGTPLQNNLREYYHMVQFVKPNLLGTFKEYTNRFSNPIINGQYDDSTDGDIMLMKKRSHVLHSILKNTVQRFEVTELNKYLPVKVDYVLFIKLHPVQINLYKKYMESLPTDLRENNKLFSHYHLMQPMWTHPYILQIKDMKPVKKKLPAVINTQVEVLDEDPQIIAQENNNILSPDWWKNIAPPDCDTNLDYGPKFKIMVSIINECDRINDKLLIFSFFITELDAIEKFLIQSDSKWKHGVNYLRMDGNVSLGTRQKYCNSFNAPGSNIKFFLISHRVGGLGLNLAAANRVILMDVCWNPSHDNQSIFRIYRFGQLKSCYIYRLVSMGTMEEVVYQRSVTKQAIAGRVVDEMQITRHYKSIDLSSMYRCNLDYDEVRPTPKLPADELLARLLQTHENVIFKYHEHQSLLENLPNEELDQSEMKLAWEEFNRENAPPPPQPPPPVMQPKSLNPHSLNTFIPRPHIHPGVTQWPTPTKDVYYVKTPSGYESVRVLNATKPNNSLSVIQTNLNQLRQFVNSTITPSTSSGTIQNGPLPTNDNPPPLSYPLSSETSISLETNTEPPTSFPVRKERSLLPRTVPCTDTLSRNDSTMSFLPRIEILPLEPSINGIPVSLPVSLPVNQQHVVDVDHLDLLKNLESNSAITFSTVIDDEVGPVRDKAVIEID